MKLKKLWDGKYQTTDGKYSVSITNCRIKGLYPKWYVSRGYKLHTYVSTLKEAQAVIDKWEREGR